MVLPRTNQALREEIERRSIGVDQGSRPPKLDYEVEYLLSRLFESIKII